MLSICFVIIIAQLRLDYGTAAVEPHCSKFDFEEKILEKLVRMEFQTERMRANFEDSLKEIVTLKDELKTAIDDAKQSKIDMAKEMNEKFTAWEESIIKANEDAEQSKIDMAKEMNAKFTVWEERIIKTLEQRTNEIQSISEKVITPRIAFRSLLDVQTTLSVGQTLVFPKVLLNEGECYNPSTGIFTTPVNGTYIFSVTLCPVYQNQLTYDVVVDGAVMNKVYLYGDAGYSCQSSSTNLILSNKQRVSIKISYIHPSSVSIYGDTTYHWNVLSGTLISI